MRSGGADLLSLELESYLEPEGRDGAVAPAGLGSIYPGSGLWDADGRDGAAPDDGLRTTAAAVPEPSLIIIVGLSVLAAVGGGRRRVGRRPYGR